MRRFFARLFLLAFAGLAVLAFFRCSDEQGRLIAEEAPAVKVYANSDEGKMLSVSEEHFLPEVVDLVQAQSEKTSAAVKENNVEETGNSSLASSSEMTSDRSPEVEIASSIPIIVEPKQAPPAAEPPAAEPPAAKLAAAKLAAANAAAEAAAEAAAAKTAAAEAAVAATVAAPTGTKTVAAAPAPEVSASSARLAEPARDEVKSEPARAPSYYLQRARRAAKPRQASKLANCYKGICSPGKSTGGDMQAFHLSKRTDTEAYVINERDSTVSIVDRSRGLVSETFSVGYDPRDIVLGPERKYMYVASVVPSIVSAVDIQTLETVWTVALPGCPMGLVLSPDGKKLCVTNYRSRSLVTVIDTESKEITGSIPVSSRPEGIAVSSDGSLLYVLSTAEKALLGVDLESGAVVKKRPLEGRPEDIVVSSDGRRIYVAIGDRNAVLVVDATGLEVVRSLTVGRYPHGLALSPDDATLYVGNYGGDSLSVIDTDLLTVEMLPSGGDGPWALKLDREGSLLYITHLDGNLLTVMNLATREVNKSVSVGKMPVGLAL